jgi:carboxyl-terminal processing protease
MVLRNGLVLLLSVLILSSTPGLCEAQKAKKPTIGAQAHTLGQLAELVRRQYYEQTDPVDLYHGAIEGYLSKLDPHSTYITPEDLQQTQERLRGSFEGIGIYFDIIGNYLTVLSPIEGSPAYQVGLLPGDKIVKIDGRSSLGIKKASEVTRRLKGPKGSRVQVTVQRSGQEELIEFSIVRDKIEVPSVPYAFRIGAGIGYVKINRFSSRTAKDLRASLEDLKTEGIRKLIVDLRGNGGGYLEQAVAVANQFVERQRLVVYTEGRRKNSREDHFAEAEPVIGDDIPILVLVNSYSASASEIVAGAIQDYDRGIIVGRTTFGKGLVQKQYPLKNGGAVLLTVARYFTPSDRPIQRPFSADRSSYLKAAHDGYDPNQDPDSLSQKPVYFTKILHRKVYGSGGISPDVTLKIDSLNTFERRLSRRYFFEFASLHAAEFTRKYPEFEEFLQRYTPGRKALSLFKSFLDEKEFDFSDRDFKSGTDLVRNEIKRHFAQIRWGSRAAGQVHVSQDTEVQRSLPLFVRAEKLLADRIYYYNRGQTHIPDPTGQVR